MSLGGTTPINPTYLRHLAKHKPSVDAEKSPRARCRLVVGWMWVVLVLMGC
jgi:hypothetical protein